MPESDIVLVETTKCDCEAPETRESGEHAMGKTASLDPLWVARHRGVLARPLVHGRENDLESFRP